MGSALRAALRPALSGGVSALRPALATAGRVLRRVHDARIVVQQPLKEALFRAQSVSLVSA